MSSQKPTPIWDLPQIKHLTKTVHREIYPAIDPSNPANAATGKTVLITGGTQGVGYAIAQGFATAGAGIIILVARRQEALDSAAASLRAEYPATDIWTYRLDIRDTGAIEETFAAIRARLNEGKDSSAPDIDVDILVTNAAVLDQGATTLEHSAATMSASFDTNVFANLALVKAFLAPEIPAIPLSAVTGYVKDTSGAEAPRREKVILDVSTVAGFIMFPGQAFYSATKAAFTHLMRHVQADVDRLPGGLVRVHSFQPGALWTEGVEARMSGNKDVVGWDDISLPRGFAVWLASPAAAFLKGRFVWANWDVEEMVAQKEKFEKDPEFCAITLNHY